MSDTKDLERRIAAALDRISAAASRPRENPALTQRLAAERQEKADLEARVAALKARQDGRIRQLESQAEGFASRITELDAVLQRMRGAMTDLRHEADTLRAGALSGDIDAEAINRSLAAEVEALRAEREAEAAEVAAILAALSPVLEEE